MSNKDKTNQIETYLDSAMKSVRPPEDVMQRLRQRIGNLEPHYLAKRLSNIEFWIILVGSVMSVAMVILTFTRALFYFFQRRKRVA
ncbi:MAG: hypothetical protein HN855_06190 [Anaerolineae bacterium]|mgnify:CR=1 FL=1|jgi:hypothetical protein|nr:hypothetical protein [Anaerolineae bacterium]MBT7070763.1 hypothetical protein [Anaerolineae bacterium]MBT7324728.1 hypothetical protein [Anaerolineae bacterium]